MANSATVVEIGSNARHRRSRIFDCIDLSSTVSIYRRLFR